MTARTVTRYVVVLIAALAGGRSASADGGLAAGPVLLADSSLGVRGALDSGLLVLAGERLRQVDGDRTRGELALRLRLHVARGISLEPQLGAYLLDYQDTGVARRIRVSGTGALRMSFQIIGPLMLIIEPLRLEVRAVDILVPHAPREVPVIDRTLSWQLGGWAALRVGW